MGACCICRKVVVCTPQMCDESYLSDMCLLVMVSFLSTGTVSHIGCTCTLHPSCSKTRLYFFFSRWSLLAPSIPFSVVPCMSRFYSCPGPLFKIGYLSSPIYHLMRPDKRNILLSSLLCLYLNPIKHYKQKRTLAS